MAKSFVSIDEAVMEYVALRDHLRAESAKFKDFEKNLKADMVEISMWLREKGDELGVNSFNTQYGTAYRNIKTRYSIGDWNAYIDWVKSTDNFQCLEHRAAKLAVKEIHDATGEIPPGLEYFAEVDFDVRRPTK